MGYLLIIVFAVILVPVVYLIFARRAGPGSSEGQRPIGKPVEVAEPSADEPTPAASSMKKDTTEAQRRTPAA